MGLLPPGSRRVALSQVEVSLQVAAPEAVHSLRTSEDSECGWGPRGAQLL